ncbi:interleukin 15, like isoform X2 [Nerophis ophidion]|uniref:interleukin 15, like isoform X2 n=1 Tax=Nerophis ophidion TaxID=159077 RepID=UPI002ADF2572|nr:interleukin 15, like isoform X2 [Nerophis ophidion]
MGLDQQGCAGSTELVFGRGEDKSCAGKRCGHREEEESRAGKRNARRPGRRAGATLSIHNFDRQQPEETAGRYSRRSRSPLACASPVGGCSLGCGQEGDDGAMLRPRSALMGMVLCMACLIEAPGQILSPDLVQEVEYLMKEDPTLCAGCKLYTPTWRDYQCCPVTTLECFSDEVNVLIWEWKVVPEHGLAQGLKNFADMLTQGGTFVTSAVLFCGLLDLPPGSLLDKETSCWVSAKPESVWRDWRRCG